MNFGEVYERYVHDETSALPYLSGNEASADDLTAETFVHAFYGPSNIRINTVKAYLLAIARNLYRDWMDRQWRLVAMGEVEEWADRAPQPDRLAADRQALRNVMEAFQNSLGHNEKHWRCLWIRTSAASKLPVLLDCSEPAVKVPIHRARLQLTGN